MGYPDTFEGFMVEDPKKWSTFKRREFKPKKLEPYDVDLEIIACGVCGSDLHAATSGWGEDMMPFPLCPGHEVIGRVVAVGEKVNTLKVGDRAGVGAQIWSCLEDGCAQCKSGNENYCPKQVDTYGAKYPDGTISYGGYSSHIRAHEYFTFPIPSALSTTLVAPMLCAGLTVFSPLKRSNIGPGSTVGIVGVGGLGHFAIQFAAALGAEVYALSHSESKVEDAKKMGAKEVILTNKEKWSDKWKLKFDMLLNTADAADGFDMSEYLGCLNVHGRFWNAALPDKPLPQIKAFDLATNGAFICGSHIGNREECLEMLKLAADKGIEGWVETIDISEDGCKEALERLNKNDVRYRFTLVGFDKAFGNQAAKEVEK
ncbi:NADPH-dependent medium chain alcohol dehydrogenase [Ascodesmis nigricans]|uniref:NADPH-dependent medium chain alcohol dehydrogenase n=1 Tax=Ascodesmis nigricans TaxID=341454 RepID=A0A4S2MW45_9PEZI|nr:NADPH-dependent medium chain alcohol dehydrogenase [Ascodesmis nigricans]